MEIVMLSNVILSLRSVKLSKLSADERAVTAIEYALIAALIAVVIIGAVTALGGGVSSTFNTVANSI
jgi:pilus assembly protein Flp/PilA